MDTVYNMLTLNATAYAIPLFVDLRNTKEDAGCLEMGIKRAIAEVGFVILSVASLIETIARAILSLPFVAITYFVGFDNCPEIVQRLAMAPLFCPALVFKLVAWTITNIYKKELSNDSSDSSALDIFPCTKPYFEYLDNI